jgi:hypothetical protein
MKSIKFTALVLGAVLFLGLGATSLSAKCGDAKKVEKADKAMKCGAGKCGAKKDAKATDAKTADKAPAKAADAKKEEKKATK